MIWWPFINILIGLYCTGSGIYGYLQFPEEQLFPIPHIRDWHISLALGIINLVIGIPSIIYLNI